MEQNLKSGFLPEKSALKVLSRDCWLAAANWIDWQDDFACPLDKDLPVLGDKERFAKFWKEYKLLQGEPHDKVRGRDRFRCELRRLYDRATEDPESVAVKLKKETGCRKRHVSLVTKLNAFRCPERFIARDTLNRTGLQRTFEKRPKDYAEHLCWCRSLSKALCVSGFVETCFGDNMPFESDQHAAFAMRVVDCALMRVGRAKPWPPHSEEAGDR